MIKKIPKIPLKIPKVIKTNDVPVSLRTRKDERKYGHAKKQKKSKPQLLNDPRIREWKYWALIENDFPYSSAFKVHHMLIPKRVVNEQNLTAREHEELRTIFDELHTQYDCRLVNFNKKQSIRDHYHIHMLTYKDKRRELKR